MVCDGGDCSFDHTQHPPSRPFFGVHAFTYRYTTYKIQTSTNHFLYRTLILEWPAGRVPVKIMIFGRPTITCGWTGETLRGNERVGTRDRRSFHGHGWGRHPIAAFRFSTFLADHSRNVHDAGQLRSSPGVGALNALAPSTHPRHSQQCGRCGTLCRLRAQLLLWKESVHLVSFHFWTTI